MVVCEPEGKEIPVLRWLAPPIAGVLILAGLLLVGLLWLPGRFVPALDLTARFRSSALAHYGVLRELIVRGVVLGKIRCVLTSHAFRTSPRLAAFLWHHLGKTVAALALLAAASAILLFR